MKKKKSKLVRKTISIPENVYKHAKKVAFVRDQSFSAYVTDQLQGSGQEKNQPTNKTLDLPAFDLGLGNTTLDRDFIYSDIDEDTD